MKLNWNFLGGEGVLNKKPSVGEYGHFLELHKVVLFSVLYNVVLTFEYVDEILKCDHSNESY